MSILVNGIKARNVVFNGNNVLKVQNKTPTMIFAKIGTTWTKICTSGTFYDVIYHNGVFIDKGWQWSEDCIKWNRCSGITDFSYFSYCRNLCFVNNKIFSINGRNIVYSEDLKTWKAVSNLYLEDEYYELFYIKGLLYCVSRSSGKTSYSSKDGENWKIFDDFDASYIAEAKFINDVCFSVKSDKLYRSEDLKTWTVCCDCEAIKKIMYKGGVYVINTYDSVIFSKDSIQWERSDISDMNGSGLEYVEGVWFASGYNGIYFSKDVKHWKLMHRSFLSINTAFCCLLFVDGKLFGFSASAGGGVYLSEGI